MISAVRNHHRLFALLALSGGIWLLDARGQDFVGPPAPDSEDREDPFPIRRVMLPKDRLATELEKAKQGAYQRLSRVEFEKLVRKAARVSSRQVEEPRLLATHYRAKLIGEGLVENSLEGTAEWKIANPKNEPRLLPLEPLRIAVTQARWTNNRKALFGSLDPRPNSGFALLVEEAGEPALAIDWSARGIPAPGELRFDLEVPVCPIASLEIELPADLALVLRQDEPLLTGPFPIPGQDQRRTWRIAFGGLSRLEISLRHSATTAIQPPLMTTLTTRQDLSTGVASNLFTIEYQVLHGDVADLLIEFDGDLTPTEVNVQNLESWQVVPSMNKGKQGLRIHLREPSRGGQLRIAATSSLPFNEQTIWTSPTLRVVGAIERSEQIRIRIASDLRLMEWRTGSFRCTRVDHSAGSTTFVLESSLMLDNPNSATRPSARVRSSGIDYRLRQNFFWDIDTQQALLTSRIHLDTRRGGLTQLQFQLPADYEVESVVAEPSDLQPRWTILTGAPPLLRIEWVRPFVAGGEGQLTVRLKYARPISATNTVNTLPFPDLVPVGNQPRQGEYRLRVNSIFEATAPPADERAELAGPVLPEDDANHTTRYYRWYGQPPTGSVTLTAKPSRGSVRTEQTVDADDGRRRTTTRLTLIPEGGALSEVILIASTPIARPLWWRTIRGDNQVVAAEPVHLARLTGYLNLLGMRGPASLAACLGANPEQRWWRLKLARPLSAPLAIEAEIESVETSQFRESLRRLAFTSSNPTSSAVVKSLALIDVATRRLNHRWEVPLVRPLGLVRQSETVSIRLPVKFGRVVASPALIPGNTTDIAIDREQTYRIGEGAWSLTIDFNAERSNNQIASVEAAQLIAMMPSSGRTRCYFSFRVRHWEADWFSVGLPVESEVVSIAVAGRLLLPSQYQVETRRDGINCRFRVPRGKGGQAIEILYLLPESKWWFTTNLVCPVPTLPVPPAFVRREWRLPPEIVPSFGEGLTQLPGGPARNHRLDLPWLSTALSPGDALIQEQTGAIRLTPGPKGGLPKTFSQTLLSSGLAGEKPLLDLTALAEAGIRDDSKMLTANWEALGLVAASFPGGTVLTTPRQVSIWRANGKGGAYPKTVADALQEAVRSGRDASGRFRVVADWAESFPRRDGLVLLAQLGGDEPGWTAWELREGDFGSPLSIVHTRHASILGWLAAALLSAIGILLVGRLGKTGTILLLIWLLAAGGAVLWLPASLCGLAVGPFLAGMLVAVVSASRRRPRGADTPTAVMRRSTGRYIPAALPRVTAILLCLAPTVNAVAPEPVTVWLIPGPPSDPEPRSVLVPSEVVDRLKHLAQPRLALVDAVFLSSSWKGQGGAANAAEFVAELHLMAFVDQTTIELPMGDIRLREALIDGAAAFPKPLGAGRFSFEIHGRGEHRIDLKFNTVIGGTGSDREVRFSLPETAITQLTFTAPQGSKLPRAVNWQGAQRVSAQGNELQADLGRTRSVHLSWRQAGANTPAQIRAQTSAVWDIDPLTATLYAAFDYRVSQGSIQAFQLLLPPNVEISRLELRPESNLPGVTPSWIRNWRQGPNRILNVELQSALSGSFQVLLVAVPTKPWTKNPALQFPTPVEGGEGDAYFAYRLRGLESSVEPERRGVTEFSTDSFLKDIWRTTGLENAPAPVTKAFRRMKNELPLVRPTLTVVSSVRRAAQEVVWNLGPRGGAVQCTASWTAVSEPLTHVEWDVPASIVVHDVRGIALHSWLRSGERVHAWLREPASEVTLLWQGTLARNAAAGEAVVIELPPIRLGNVAVQQTILRLRSPVGWTITADNPVDFARPVPASTARELALQPILPEKPGRFILRTPQVGAPYRSLTIAEVIDSRLQLSNFLDVNLRRDRPHSFQLSVAGLGGWEVDLRAPADCRVIAHSLQPGRREWTIEVPVRDVDRSKLSLILTRSLATAGEFDVPLLSLHSVDRTAHLERTFGFIGPELEPRASQELVRTLERPEVLLAQRPSELARWRERGGTFWQSMSTVSPRFRAAPSSLADTALVRIGLIDLEVARLGNRWLHRARVDLLQENDATLFCELPENAILEGMGLDGVACSLPKSNGRFAIPLPAEAGHRLVHLIWSLPEPRWEIPSFTSTVHRLPVDTVLWTALAPAGSFIEVDGAHSLAAHDLRRADALLRFARDRRSAALDETAITRIASRATRWTRLAEAALSSPRTPQAAAEKAPDGSTLAEWSTRLRESALSLRGSTPVPPGLPVRESGFDLLPHAEAFRAGIPVHWSSSTPSASDVRMVSVALPSAMPTLASFGLLCLAIGGLGLLMLLLSRLTRPEQIAVIGLLGVIAFGWPEGLLFVSLTTIALLIRLAWVGQRIYRLLGGS